MRLGMSDRPDLPSPPEPWPGPHPSEPVPPEPPPTDPFPPEPEPTPPIPPVPPECHSRESQGGNLRSIQWHFTNSSSLTGW
jgi:hypothetical protein